MTEKNTYLRGALLLSITNLITGVIAFVYRIYLTKAVGTEGIGIYQLILPLYIFFITMVSSGLITTISKLVAESRFKNNYSNIYSLIKIALIISGLWSSLLAVLITFNANFLANYILKDSRTAYSIMVFTPAIIFIALSAVLKGYFYGMEKVSIPSIIDIGEKAIRLVFLIFATKYFINLGIEFVCVGAMLAMVCGELLSLILLFSFYKYKSKRKMVVIKKHKNIFLIKSILTPLIPLSIGGNIESILDMLDAVLIPSKLVEAGFTKSEALSIFGELTGMVIPLLYFPMIIIGSLSTTLVPAIAYSHTSKNRKELNKKCNDSLAIASIVGFASSVIFLTYPQELCRVLYNCPEAGDLLYWSAFPCVLEYWLFTIMAILNGAGFQRKVLQCTLANILIMTFSILFFVPIQRLNIYGYVIGFAISSGYVVLKGISILRKQMEIKLNLNEIVLKPLFCSLLMLTSIKSLNNYLILYSPTRYNMILSYTAGLAIYFFFLLLFKIINPIKENGFINTNK